MRSSIKHSFFKASRPIIFGHRGAEHKMPENTLIAFDQALKEGADVLETDMHLTKDGEVVLIHDSTVDRVTNGTGQVKQYTLAQLKQLDAAYRFSLDGGKSFPLRGKGHTIPTLAEALDRYPHAKFNLDLKSNDPALIKKTVDIISAKNRTDSVILGAFCHKTTKRLRRYIKANNLDIKCSASKKEIGTLILSSKLGLPSFKKPLAYEVPVKRKGVRVITNKFIRHAHKQGHHVVAWTINDPAEMQKLIDMGVDGIVTSHPRLAVKIAKAHKPS